MNNAAKNLQQQQLEEAKQLARSGSFKDIKDAEKILMDVIAADPKSAAAWHELGTAYYRGKDFEQAATAFLRRLELEPEKTVANYSLAVTLIELKRVDEARKYLTRALQLDPGYTRARQRLAEIAPAKESKKDGLQNQASNPGARKNRSLDEDESDASSKELMSKGLMKGDAHPGKLLTEAKPLARNYIFVYLLFLFFLLVIGVLGGGGVRALRGLFLPSFFLSYYPPVDLRRRAVAPLYALSNLRAANRR